MATDRPAPSATLIEVSEEGLRRTRNWGIWINLGSFLVGYSTAVIAGALLYVSDDLDLGAGQQGFVTSVLLLSAMVAALMTGPLADRFGRRLMLGASGLVFAAGFVVAALAPGFVLLVVGRLVMGLGVGVSSALVPTYLREMSPAQIRGRMLTLNQLLQTVGMLVAYIVNLAFSGGGDWRTMFAVGVIPAALLAIAAARLPESPAWLIAQERIGDAHAMLSSVAGSASADKVIERYRREEDQERRQREQDSLQEETGWRALMTARVRPALVVGVGLAALQQFIGINTVLYFAPTIMQQTGLSASNSIVYSVIIGVINLAMTVVSLRLIDRIGRRPLLQASLIGMTSSVALLGISFLADLDSLILLLCMLIYVSSFAVGMGPVLWVILGEVFPSRVQAEGSGAGSSANWLANFIVSTAFLPLADVIGTGEVFLIFAVISLVALLFVHRRVPETKDRDFAQIDADLQARARGGTPETAGADGAA